MKFTADMARELSPDMGKAQEELNRIAAAIKRAVESDETSTTVEINKCIHKVVRALMEAGYSVNVDMGGFAYISWEK